MTVFAALLQSEFGEVATLDSLWGGAADYDGSITTEEIEAIPAFAGMTHEAVNEVVYIASNLKGLIEGRLAAIAIMAPEGAQG